MQQTYYCPTCRAPVPYGAQFCQYCGNQLHWQSQSNPPPIYQQPPSYQQQQVYYGYRAEESKRKRNIWVLIVVCLITVFIGVIYFTLNGSTQSDQLQIINHKMNKDDYGVKVTGTAKNVTSRNLFARVSIKYYDASGTLIDSGVAYTERLGAGETWNFETTGLKGEKAAKVARYEISGRDSFIRD